MRLHGKSRREQAAALKPKSRAELLELIYRLTTFEHCLTPGEIAEAFKCRKRDVVAAMKSGQFIDPVFGPGFFTRGQTSMRVTTSAANQWRRDYFVPVEPIPAEKKERAAAQTGVDVKKAAQKGGCFSRAWVAAAKRWPSGDPEGENGELH